MRHIAGSQGDDIGRGTAVLSHQLVLILLGNLFRNGLGGVIQFMEAVFLSNCRIHALIRQRLIQIVAKRFSLREEYTTVAYCIALHKVEITI